MTEAEAIKHFATMQQAADDRAFFTDGELASVTTALERLGLDHDRSAGLKEVLGRSAHLDYKRWHMTRATATSLANELPPVSDIEFSNAFKRVLEGGNWAPASIYAAAKQSKNDRDRPWVVLVTGLNGVRKTTAIYEPWFEAALAEAIVGPDGSRGAPKRVQLPADRGPHVRQGRRAAADDGLRLELPPEQGLRHHGTEGTDQAAAEQALGEVVRVSSGLVKRRREVSVRFWAERRGLGWVPRVRVAGDLGDVPRRGRVVEATGRHDVFTGPLGHLHPSPAQQTTNDAPQDAEDRRPRP